MQRTRSAPPASSAGTGVDSFPAEPSELSVLVEKARAPWAGRAEVDALLVGLSRPLLSEDSPRKRADLLLSLIEDEQLADYTGTHGGTVRSAATRALVALGYPYALEVPPEALAKVHEEDTTQGPSVGLKAKLGFGLVSLSAVSQVLLLITVASSISSSSPRMDLVIVLSTLFSFTATFTSGLLILLGRNRGSHGLKVTGLIGLVLVTLVWLVAGFLFVFALQQSLLLLLVGGALATGTVLMAWED